MSGEATNWEPFQECTEACAVPVPCPTCGRDLPPAGRSVGLDFYLPPCCDEARHSRMNTRHIWSNDELPAAAVVGGEQHGE